MEYLADSEKLTSYCGGCIGDKGVVVLVHKILRYIYSLVDGYSCSEYKVVYQ